MNTGVNGSLAALSISVVSDIKEMVAWISLYISLVWTGDPVFKVGKREDSFQRFEEKFCSNDLDVYCSLIRKLFAI